MCSSDLIYLNDLPFASFRPAGGARQTFSFVCRPQGRTLALRLNPGYDSNGNGSVDEGDVTVTMIVASEEQGSRILLYENSGRQGPHEG